MFHNSVEYGIISTVNSFIFLRRERNGKLNVTPLIPATRTDPTILCLLYYFSNLCATASLLRETHQDGRLITVIRAPSDSSIAPLVPAPSINRTPSGSPLSRVQLDPPRRSPRFQPGDESPILACNTHAAGQQVGLDIDVSVPGTWLGCKGYKGVLHTGEPVFAKLWDGWKHSAEEADRESTIYTSLRDVWGTLIPRLIAHGGWGFCHIIVLEFVKVTFTIVFNISVTELSRVQFCRI